MKQSINKSLDFTFVNDKSADILIKDVASFSKPGQYRLIQHIQIMQHGTKLNSAVSEPIDYKHSTIHEFGHGLGLEHPFEDDDGDIWPGMEVDDDVYSEGPSTKPPR